MSQRERLPAWLVAIAERHAASPAHTQPCLGSVGLIDNAARRRGLEAVSAGSCVSLSLDVAAAPALRADGAATFEIEPHVDCGGDVTVGTDRIHLDAHGIPNTHLDGLAHIG